MDVYHRRHRDRPALRASLLFRHKRRVSRSNPQTTTASPVLSSGIRALVQKAIPKAAREAKTAGPAREPKTEIVVRKKTITLSDFASFSDVRRFYLTVPGVSWPVHGCPVLA